MQSAVAIRSALFREVTKNGAYRLFPVLSNHVSESVRCRAAYLIGLDDNLEIEKKLEAIKPFAADAHFGVREISWMAVKYSIVNDLDRALALLYTWVDDNDASKDHPDWVVM